MDITDLLAFAVKNQASDLHLSAGMPPLIRVEGDIRKVNLPIFSATEVENLICNVMNDHQRKFFEQNLELDFSFSVPHLSRFRVNIFQQLRGTGAVFRVIPNKISSLEELMLPETFVKMTEYRNGLVLVTGPTGSGKSTTLAAMIDRINQQRYEHVITIEDPIEFVHSPKKCLINQRELHQHTLAYSSALRSALREDPDVILVGEMRDLETMRLALTAAETGHLVFATLHTNSAAKTVSRIIDVFPTAEKEMVRSMLSDSLQAVVSQRLLKRVGCGLIPAHEIMICNSAIRNLIRENKIAQIYSAIQTGQNVGMQTFDQNLGELVGKQLITSSTARTNALDPSMFIG